MNTTDLVVYATPNGTKYHRTPACESLERASAEGRVRDLTADDALAQQLAPCGLCKPKQLAPPTPEVLNVTGVALLVIAAQRRYEAATDRNALVRSSVFDALVGVFETLTGLETPDAIAYAQQLAQSAADSRPSTRAAVLPF